LIEYSIQTISGTGANHYGGAFLERFYEPWQGKSKEDKVIYISNPTWGEWLKNNCVSFLKRRLTFPPLPANHKSIFANVGLKTVDYPYYDPSKIGLALPKFLEFLRQAPEQSVFLLHACAHNPTGVDPTREEWKEISQIFKEKKHFAFFDCAYQVSLRDN
jgi:aspartate aminotransferase